MQACLHWGFVSGLLAARDSTGVRLARLRQWDDGMMTMGWLGDWGGDGLAGMDEAEGGRLSDGWMGSQEADSLLLSKPR